MEKVAAMLRSAISSGGDVVLAIVCLIVAPVPASNPIIK
jgi:hypothetical protein